jgi:hypothetical protein
MDPFEKGATGLMMQCRRNATKQAFLCGTGKSCPPEFGDNIKIKK